jgi:hypothetical protein
MSGSTPGTSRARYERPVTLDQIALAAARLITEARAAGLAPPFSLNCHDYGPPTIGLYISSHDVPDIRAALQSWADCYRTHLSIRRSSKHGMLTADVTFTRQGIRCEVTGVITGPATPEPADTPEPAGSDGPPASEDDAV